MLSLSRATERPRWHPLGAWIAFALLCLSTPVAAQAERPLVQAIQVEPGASCVTAEALLPQVEAWLGQSRVQSDLSVAVLGSPLDPRDVSMEIRRNGRVIGQRRFQPAPFVCSQLEASLALAVAMGLKVSLRDEVLDSLGGSAPHSRNSVAALARVGFGLLPSTSLGAGVQGARSLGTHFGLRAEAFADGAWNATFTDAPGNFGTLLLSGQLSACALVPFNQHWSARACLGMGVGALWARGDGYNASQDDWLAWLAASNGLALSYRLSGPWWLDLAGSIVIPLNKVSFGVEQEPGVLADARTLARLGFTAGLGPSYHF